MSDHSATLVLFLPILGGQPVCLNAFMVALNQACEGGEERWNASTALGAQLTSMEFCRRAEAFHLCSWVCKDQTPR